jgi:hypothetical protein
MGQIVVDKQTTMSQDERKWILRATKLIKIKELDSPSFGQRPVGGCSQSTLIPCDPPIKEVFGTFEREFLFDENRSIPLVTKLFYNFAECTGHSVLETPSEEAFYKENAHIEDINELIQKAIPVVAKILQNQSALDELGFDKKINELLCFKKISEESVEKMAESVKLRLVDI